MKRKAADTPPLYWHTHRRAWTVDPPKPKKPAPEVSDLDVERACVPEPPWEIVRTSGGRLAAAAVAGKRPKIK